MYVWWVIDECGRLPPLREQRWSQMSVVEAMFICRWGLATMFVRCDLAGGLLMYYVTDNRIPHTKTKLFVNFVNITNFLLSMLYCCKYLLFDMGCAIGKSFERGRCCATRLYIAVCLMFAFCVIYFSCVMDDWAVTPSLLFFAVTLSSTPHQSMKR